MFTRVFAAAFCLLLCGAVRADVIAISNSDFDADLSGWTVGVNPIGNAFWKWDAGGQELSGPNARLDVQESAKTSTLSQTFASTGVIPGQVDSADLSWTQYLFATAPTVWDANQSFRVLLSDTTDTLEVFTRAGGPQEFGTFGTGALAQNNSAALVAFLNQLTLGESLTLTFEAFTTGSMLAAVDDINFTFELDAEATPEPSSLVLGGLGLVALSLMRRHRKAGISSAVA